MLSCNSCVADYAPPWKEATRRQDERRSVRYTYFFWPLIACAALIAVLSLSIGLGVGLGLLPSSRQGLTVTTVAPPSTSPPTSVSFSADRSRDVFQGVSGTVVFEPFSLTTCATDDVAWLAFLTNHTGTANFDAFLVMNATVTATNCVAWSVAGSVDFSVDQIASGLRT